MAASRPPAVGHHIRPGHIVLPARAARLAVVVGSGIVLTLFDRQRARGGLSYYTHPIRKRRLSGPMFAAPAIVRLVEMFRDLGSEPCELEATLIGGAVNPRSPRFEPGLSEANVATGLQILAKLRIASVGQDVGGARGRKVAFHTGTGETIVAKVANVRQTDWYPPFDPDELVRLEQRCHARNA